ncbi:MAG: transglutaminase domain-containing protein [Bacteroidota bacterium]
MRKTISLIFLMLTTISLLIGQEYSREYGIISDSEWSLQTYEKDPDAGAVVMFDIGSSFYATKKDGDIVIRFKKQKRVKILDETGFEASKVTIPIYIFNEKESEQVVEFQATSYLKVGGQVVSKQVEAESVFEETIDENWKVKKFTFPDVQVGSVLEYSYVLETSLLPDWVFQSNIPTIHSEYKVGMVPFFEYVFITQGIDTFDVQTVQEDKMWKKIGQIKSYSGQNMGEAATYRDIIYTYVLKDVAAFKDESYITSVNDYIAKIDFQLSNTYDVPTYVSEQYQSLGQATVFMTTWPKMIEDFLAADVFGKYLKASEGLARKLLNSELNLDGQSKAQQARAIINYVKRNFKWNGETRKLARLKPKEFVSQKQGDSAEINLFLTAMLRAAGIEAQPVILSTRDHGKIKANYPFQHFFNNVITLINEPGLSYLTDATDPLIAYNRIPPRCINENGLIVNKGEGGWVNLESKFLSLNNKLFSVSIDPESSVATAGVTIQSSEYHAYAYKNAYGKNEEAVKNGMLENGLSDVSQIRFINYEKNTKPYVIAFKATAEVEEVGGKLILSPFFKFPIAENSLVEEERKYPIDLVFAESRSFKSQINIPEGYTIKQLPEGLNMKDELTAIKLNYQMAGKQLIVEGSYSFKKAVFQPEEYAQVKNLLNRVIEKFNQEIVFDPL